jgi:outer membrane murein-binding lipoprotein Lpp
MKRTGIFLVLLCAAALSGCATESFVREQIDPLNARVCTLESKVGALENRMNDMDGKMTAYPGDIAAAKQAADDAAAKADAAAQKADDCAARCGKAFELGQKNGKVFLEVHRGEDVNYSQEALKLIKARNLASLIDRVKLSRVLREKSGIPEEISR